jgi:ABC-type dipeptide/oligopeptide/nickel transport system, ATPase component
MESAQNVILSVRDIVVKFRVRNKELTAIRRISMDLFEGETLAIVGESGSGKTVLTKTFTGMLESNGRIDSGSIVFEGQELTALKTDRQWETIRGAKISTVFQDPMTSLNPLKKIGIQITEVIEKHQKLPNAEAQKITLSLMERVGIKNAEHRFNDYPFQYSGGMRQRIVIAIALACKPTNPYLRRAHHRPRCHHTGADSRPYSKSATRVWIYDYLYHA